MWTCYVFAQSTRLLLNLRAHDRSRFIDDMMACYWGISVIAPWLASLAVFVSVHPSSLTSTASLVRLQARWLICACDVRTHQHVTVGKYVCVHVHLIIPVFADPCETKRSVEILWHFLWKIACPHIFSTQLSTVMKEWKSDKWAVHSKEETFFSTCCSWARRETCSPKKQDQNVSVYCCCSLQLLSLTNHCLLPSAGPLCHITIVIKIFLLAVATVKYFWVLWHSLIAF